MLENIDSKKVAYLVGYMAGDGCFENGAGKRTDRMSFTSADKEIYDWITTTFQLSEAVQIVRGNNESLGIFATKDAYRKTFPTSYSKEFNNFGILCKKEYRTVQNIKKSDMKYWLLGFLDADGMISWSVRKDRDRIVAKVNFTHPSTKLLEKIQTFLRDELNISSSIKAKGMEKCYVLAFSKMRDVIRFGDFIYSDTSAIVLTRKYDNFFTLKKQFITYTQECKIFPKEFMKSFQYGNIIGAYSNFVFISPEGKEFPAASIAAAHYNLDKKTVQRNARLFQKGWSSREKTEYEKEDWNRYVERKIKQLYAAWLEENPL